MNCSHQLPPGFRFHPTDEELIVHYLRNQSMSRPCPAQIISQVDIYKFDPWQLPEKAEIGENEWYFFTTRDRKYPNGARPNRAAVSGYWKATGSDKEIYSGSTQVGVKKALVFYEGRPPKGFKTDWIMHEYRLVDARRHAQRDSMKLDGWVLCRIYKKGHSSRVLDKKADYFHAQKDQAMSNEANDKQTMRLPGARSLTNEYLVELGHPGLFSQLLMDTVYHPFFDNREMLGSDVTYCDEDKKLQLGGIELPQLRAE